MEIKNTRKYPVKWKRAEDMTTFELIKRGIRIKDLQYVDNVGTLSLLHPQLNTLQKKKRKK